MIKKNGKYKVYLSDCCSFPRIRKDSIPGLFDEARQNSQGLIFVRIQDKWAIYNVKLKRLHGFLFDRIDFSTSVFDTNTENTRYQIKDRYGYLNKNGDYITTAIFEKADLFKEDAVMIKLPEKQPGYMDTKGRFYFED